MNIIYFHSHDTGRYIAPYGYAVPTPHLQRLAEEGCLFRRAFCAGPTCSPSRAALFTGCTPHSVGMLGLAHKGFRLDDYSKTLVTMLNEAEYETVLCGGQHIAAHDQIPLIGYRKLMSTELNPTAAHAVGNAVEFLRTHEKGKPFFLDVGAFETHRYQKCAQGIGAYHLDGRRGNGRYVRAPEPLPDTPEVRTDWADFCESARELDAAVGELYAELAVLRLLDETLFIYTTDHGPPLPHMKCTLSDGGLQVALIMRGPGGFRGGKVCENLVSQIDLFPTICELLSKPVPPWVQGTSFCPALRKETSGREEIFGEINHHSAFNPQRCIRTERFKLVKIWPGDKDASMTCCDSSASKQLLKDAGWSDSCDERLQLYDLLLDPNESRNLASLPAWQPVVKEMTERLFQWMENTNDPLARGGLPQLSDPLSA